MIWEKWEPVLSNQSTLAAQEVIEEIACFLRDLNHLSTLSLTPLCDRGLIFAYLAIHENSDAWREHSIASINMASEKAFIGLPSGLYGGFSGIGWTIQHVSDLLTGRTERERPCGPADSECGVDALEDVDNLLLSRLRAEDWIGSYDLIKGLVGVGVYFLERFPRHTAIQGIRRILTHLERQCKESAEGISWFSPPDWLPDQQRNECPGGHYNLGVAHGIPGIIFFLGEVVALGIDRERALRLLDGALSWFIRQQQSVDPRSLYGYWVGPNLKSRGFRLAWCYGDLGIAAILSHTMRLPELQPWRRFADSLLERCLDRQPDGVIDPGLCHGAAGVAHIFNRAHQKNQDARFKYAANRYFELAISLYHSATASGLQADSSFLEGKIGLALSLLAAIAPIPPKWDRRLLLSGWSNTQQDHLNPQPANSD
jgi:hypothetical protein